MIKCKYLCSHHGRYNRDRGGDGVISKQRMFRRDCVFVIESKHDITSQRSFSRRTVTILPKNTETPYEDSDSRESIHDSFNFFFFLKRFFFLVFSFLTLQRTFIPLKQRSRFDKLKIYQNLRNLKIYIDQNWT